MQVCSKTRKNGTNIIRAINVDVHIHYNTYLACKPEMDRLY